MNNKLFSVVLAASMVLPFAAGAQQLPVNPETNSVRAVRKVIGEDTEKLREAAKTAVQAKRDDFRTKSEAAREQFKKEVEAAREAAKKSIEQKREAAKKEIEDLKDARKKEAVKRVDLNLTETNKRMVERYAANLEQLDKVLVNIVSRTDKAQARGLAVAPVRTAITAASTSIASARTLVVAQSGKTYVAAITTSTTAKSELTEMRNLLKNDLRAVEAAVKSARNAVHAAAVALAKVRGVGENEPAATSSAPAATSTGTSTAR